VSNGLTADGPDDPRQYVRISIDLPFGTKTNSVSDPVAAIAAQVIAICSAAQGFTDGHVPINTIYRAGISDTIVKEMIEEGFWHDSNSDLSECTRCQQPKPKFLYIHDYLHHQRSAAQVNEQRSKKSAAGALGAQKRWAKLREKQAAERAKTVEKAKATGEDSDVARPEVERLCNYLAGWIERNDSKNRRPGVGQAWFNDMRKMLDIDGFTVQDLKDVIEWTQKHEFWNDKVKSPFKLRKQMKPDGNDLYGRMRREKYGDKPTEIVYGRSVTKQADAGERAGKALDIAAQLDAQFGQGTDGKEIAA
jgi:hypothetical protein